MEIITTSRDKTIFLCTAVLMLSKDAEVKKPVHSYWRFWYRVVIGQKQIMCLTCGEYREKK